jgi:hypothetical protein
MLPVTGPLKLAVANPRRSVNTGPVENRPWKKGGDGGCVRPLAMKRLPLSLSESPSTTRRP